jgi:DNA polymerase III subunit delta'
VVARRTRRATPETAAPPPPIPAAPGHGWPVWGHDAAVADFRSAIAAGRVRHAYLIAGPAGSGKRTLAMAFAQALTCLAPLAPGVPCGVCRSCGKIARGVHPDVQRVSLDSQAATAEKANRQNTSLTIETVREVTGLAALRPMESAWRVTMIDDAETMQGVAQEALLKTLEEPPGYLVLILLSDDVDALLPTIRSRCQVVDLRPVARATTTALLEATGVAADDAATLAGLAAGRPGWAVRAARDRSVVERQQAAVDRALSWIGSSPYDRLVTALRIGDGFTKQREEVFADLQTVLGLWRDALLLKAGQPEYVTYRAGADALDRWLPAWDLDDVHQALCSVQTGIADLESNVRPRLALENMVLQWPTPLSPTTSR